MEQFFAHFSEVSGTIISCDGIFLFATWGELRAERIFLQFLDLFRLVLGYAAITSKLHHCLMVVSGSPWTCWEFGLFIWGEAEITGSVRRGGVGSSHQGSPLSGGLRSEGRCG